MIASHVSTEHEAVDALLVFRRLGLIGGIAAILACVLLGTHPRGPVVT